MAKNEIENLSQSCAACGNVSGYDQESLQASTVMVNGCEVTLDCHCEDELFLRLLERKISKEKMLELTEILMMDEREQIMELYTEPYVCEDEDKTVEIE